MTDAAIQDRLGKVERRNDEHIATCGLRNETQEALNTDHETRIRSIEKWVWMSAGIGGFVGSGACVAIVKLFGG